MKKLLSYIDSLNRIYRLLISLVAAIIVFAFMYRHHTVAITFMLSWITFAATTLFITWSTILYFHPQEISTVANEQDTTRLVMFLFVVGAAFISLFAIIFLLQSSSNAKGLDRHIFLSTASVFFSWVLIHTVFTLRYAHMFYTYSAMCDDDKGACDGGLEFPGTPLPDFLDFAYFSFVLGMTFQVADVNITGRKIRRLALLHGFLSFIYNTIIVALSINIISGMIAK